MVRLGQGFVQVSLFTTLVSRFRLRDSKYVAIAKFLPISVEIPNNLHGIVLIDKKNNGDRCLSPVTNTAIAKRQFLVGFAI